MADVPQAQTFSNPFSFHSPLKFQIPTPSESSSSASFSSRVSLPVERLAERSDA